MMSSSSSPKARISKCCISEEWALRIRGSSNSHFLSDFLGGPKLYAEKHGHTNVREMHVHIEIDRKAHDDWLNCMSIAIDRVGLDKDVGKKLMTHFRAVAAGLQNRP